MFARAVSLASSEGHNLGPTFIRLLRWYMLAGLFRPKMKRVPAVYKVGQPAFFISHSLRNTRSFMRGGQRCASGLPMIPCGAHGAMQIGGTLWGTSWRRQPPGSRRPTGCGAVLRMKMRRNLNNQSVKLVLQHPLVGRKRGDATAGGYAELGGGCLDFTRRKPDQTRCLGR